MLDVRACARGGKDERMITTMQHLHKEKIHTLEKKAQTREHKTTRHQRAVHFILYYNKANNKQ